ncbi:hypothetical protein IJG92_02000 [Candidatus Saccharibacteria bacterium]|nr:hypothetical protein [Candidatus Saccharibacteria bacterium]
MQKKQIHDEPTEEYKAALAAKEAQRKKEQQDTRVSQMREKQAAAKAKREMEAKKKELQSELAGKKIAECNARIKKAEETLASEKAYDLGAKITLGLFALMIFVSIAVFLVGLGVDALIIAMSIAFLTICLSIFFQTKPDFARKKISDNNKRIAKIRKELYGTKNRR